MLPLPSRQSEPSSPCRIRKWVNIACGCEVFETGFSTVEKLLTSLFRESLLISRAPISAGTPTWCALPKIYFAFGGIKGRGAECGSRSVVRSHVSSHPELHPTGREVEAPKLKALRNHLLLAFCRSPGR